MLSALSTVSWFWMPDTFTLTQCPVTVTLLVMPLTLTVPPLQAMVRTSLMPETVMVWPAGAVVAEVGGAIAVVLGTLPDGVGLTEEMLGVGNRVVNPPRVTWWALKRKIAIGRAIMPMTNSASRIQRPRPCRRGPIGGL